MPDQFCRQSSSANADPPQKSESQGDSDDNPNDNRRWWEENTKMSPNTPGSSVHLPLEGRGA